MIVQTLSFRGFNTFKKMTALNLEELGRGVFAIQGDNGAGKTTLLELLGPGVLFLKFPSRKPSEIHDYIDAKRGAMARMCFQAGGKDYEAKIEITAGGKKTACLRLIADEGEDDEELATGKVTVYTDIISRMFGPLEANLASVFGQQGGGGGFEAMAKADRKKLFRWYLGLDGIDRYHKEVGELIDRIDIDTIALTERLLAEAKEELKTVVETEATMQYEYKCALKSQKYYQKAYEKLLISAPLAEQAERFAAAEKKAEEAIELAEMLESKLAEAAEIVDTDTEALEERGNVLREVINKAGEAESACDEAVALYDDLKKDLDDAEESAELLKEVPCTEYEDCADCKFISKANLAKSKLPSLAKRIKTAKKNAEALQKVAKAAIEAGNAAEDEIDNLRNEIRHLQRLEREQHAEKVQRARDEERLATAQRDVEEALAEIESLSDGLPFNEDGDVDYESIPTTWDIREAKRELEVASETLEVAAGDKEEARVRVSVVKERVKNLKERLDGLKEGASDLRSLQLLHRALGPSGFPIFEIDAAGPDVSGIINDLLEACYGARFNVSIQTLTPKKKGGGFKEDFDFIIRDTRASEDRTIGQISGGEKTIVGEAMRIGFALYQAAKAPAPCRFQTMFRDEAEGSLSPDNARRYVRMLARARELGGFHQIFFVTHNEYAAASANGILQVKTGGNIEIKKGAV